MCPRLERFAATLFHGKPTTEMFSFYGPEIKSTQFGDATSARCCPKARFFEVARLGKHNPGLILGVRTNHLPEVSWNTFRVRRRLS